MTPPRRDRREAMQRLPPELEAYSRTADFTESSIPAGLRARHATKAGVWGRIVVLEGRLRFRIHGDAPQEHVLSPELDGVVEPEVEHEVEPEGPVRFFVEFRR